MPVPLGITGIVYSSEAGVNGPNLSSRSVCVIHIQNNIDAFKIRAGAGARRTHQ
jgi:hypothetical protein